MTIFDKLIVLIVLNTLSVYANVTKIRSGAERTLQCGPSSMSGTYKWKINNTIITNTLIGIDDSTINTDSLRIRTMTQQLVGVYECLLNDQTQATFDVKIVGLARYSMCRNDPRNCSENYIYDSTLNNDFILNATIVFVNSGTDGFTENLLDSEWEVLVPPGNVSSSQIFINNGEYMVNPLGIKIIINTTNNFSSNIATVIIESANEPFQIVHLLHTNIDDGDSGQISATFNFNYTKGTLITTTTSSAASPTTSAMPTMTYTTYKMMTSSTSEISPTTESTLGNSFTTTSSSTSSSSDVNFTSTNIPITGVDEGGDDGNSGVIIGVVVSLVIFFIIVVAVVIMAIFFWHHNKQKYRITTGGQNETAQGSGANGSAHRPTTLNCNSSVPLLDNTGSTCTTATPHRLVVGDTNLYGNTIEENSNDQQNDDDGDDVPADDSCFDPNANDHPPVEIQL